MVQRPSRIVAAFAPCVLLAFAGCATSPANDVLAGGAVSVEGTIASIDTDPWAYDGNAVIRIDTQARGQVAVQLPARWNLCKAAPVDMQALSVGIRVQAVGAPGAEGELVVCEDAAHRLVPAGGG